ncbi:TetR/AcrR family transcriptional regulator [Blastopirellula sp. JC732]|uniref:TetR/AcrR family transcriptional regulator n=1 Tax=Blastopirellula sediminis TaxID=2894196 RepID=A0A9X1MH27_9BACT|nr:TetR/AcrR family transcriptional regulator [Blastopirellula sediminis]MCC9604413.1 TetR/AcrR family transcriptional regulator [Blastopirellula sediminis]MCC9626933.1 TetR/AcrR family transcriptional regulator [Blastopirellula sediminis]
MPRTGRPREFDRDDAVRQAMHLFWEYGYEAVSVADLQKELGGISAASFYAAFGSKPQLFAEAMALYMETCGDIIAPLQDPQLPPREGLRQTLRRTIEVQTGSEHPLGCMAVLAGTNLSAKNQEIQAIVTSARAATRSAIADYVDRAVKRGDLPKKADRESLVVLFDTFIKGIAIQARDGIPKSSLLKSAENVMKAWDQAGGAA